MKPLLRPLASAAAAGIAVLAISACGGSSTSTSNSASTSTPASSSTKAATTTTSSSGSDSAIFGTPHKATGTPYVFGLINDETGAVTFPEARQAEIAAAAYVNNYLDGINGHPIELADCIGDGTAPTSARCANELIAKHPLAILGAADSGTPGSEQVYERAGLAYIGGVPFTPVEQNASNSVQFWTISTGDNAAAAVYAVKDLHAKNVAVLYFNNSQGKIAGLDVLPPTLKAAGATTVKTIAVPPTTPDPSAQVAAAIGDHPDVIYVDIPNNCGVVLKDIKSLGYTGKIMGIDPCTSPQAIASAAGAAQGLIDATPFAIGSTQYQLFIAALEKWGAKGTAIDSIAGAGFATVMNVQKTLSTIKGKLTTKTILAAFRSGSDHANYMSHPYTCGGQAMPKAVSVCNNYFLMAHVSGDRLIVSNTKQWITSNGYFKGL